MMLQLYVTVVPCFQTGWIETTGLKKSLGTDGRRVGLARNPPASTSLQALLLILVLWVVVVVVVPGGHSRVCGAAAAAASAVNLVAAVGVVGDDSRSVSPL